jgi:hypothetical protein
MVTCTTYWHERFYCCVHSILCYINTELCRKLTQAVCRNKNSPVKPARILICIDLNRGVANRHFEKMFPAAAARSRAPLGVAGHCRVAPPRSSAGARGFESLTRVNSVLLGVQARPASPSLAKTLTF